MEKLISVIVPVYNVEKYIKKCIDSILSQTYKNIEIILVDDGSPDNCGHICDEYQKKDCRINVVHKNNGGLSDARNVGLSIAKGEVIAFVDSDDYLENTTYEKMMALMKTGDCDIVECAVTSVFTDQINPPSKKNSEIISSTEALTRYLRTDGKSIPRTAVWSKIFKREILDELWFPVGKIHEDYVLVVQAFLRAKKYGIIHEGLYDHVYDNPSSITNSKFSRKDLFRLEQLKTITDIISDCGNAEHYRYSLANYYTAVIQYFYKSSYAGFCEAAEYRNILINEKDKIRVAKLNWKKRTEVLAIKVSPKLYLLIRKVISALRK